VLRTSHRLSSPKRKGQTQNWNDSYEILVEPKARPIFHESIMCVKDNSAKPLKYLSAASYLNRARDNELEIESSLRVALFQKSIFIKL
jgi:hypothetical protein